MSAGTTIKRIDPPLPLLVNIKGNWVKGLAHFLIDYGYEMDIMWVVFDDESRECWTISNKNIRSQENVSAGRSPKSISDESMAATYGNA